jgi:SAM-dependent methyltransferase
MFYPHKITRIAPTDRVLEIGPGADPFHRSDVLLELRLPDEEDYAKQFGHDRKLQTDKPVVFYDGHEFPFKDKEFDYVICSHVLEHVPDVPQFLTEVFRVAKGGYFEYPLITYEYMHNIGAHLNYVKWNGEVLYYLKKDQTPLNEFKPVQEFFFSTLINGYDEFYTRLPEFFFEGFEWDKPFHCEVNTEIKTYTDFGATVPMIRRDISKEQTVRTLVKALVQKVKRKF